jgi:intein/homing endonuclease
MAEEAFTFKDILALIIEKKLDVKAVNEEFKLRNIDIKSVFMVYDEVRKNKVNVPLHIIIFFEKLRCASDVVYFMKKYVKIQHQDRGIILFDTFEFQEDALSQLQENDRVIILKSRQMGISTLMAAYSLWMMTFNEGKNILVLSIKQDTAKEVVTKVKLAWENLPSWLKLEAIEKPALSLKLKNNSRIMAASSDSDAARSFSASILIMDEAAFIDNAQDVWTAAQQTLAATKGIAVILSTPNGVGNFFHQLWIDSERKENSFHRIKLPWHLHPERDQSWRDKQTKELGIKKAAQECFSGDTIVYTLLGPKPISNIRVGDKVLTHSGVYKKVVRTFEKNDTPCSLITNKNRIVKAVTGNHPFYHNGEWVEVKKLNNKKSINFPNVFYSLGPRSINVYDLITPKHFEKVLCKDQTSLFINDRKHKTIHNRYIECDYDFGYLIGLYLAEGSGGRLRKTFCFDANKESNGWPRKIESIVQSKFGFTNCQYRKINNSGQLSFCSEIFSNVIDLFVDGKDCYTKKLTEFAYENMSTDFAKGIVDGAFRGDGCLIEKYYKTYVSTSLSLIYDMGYLLHMIGIHNFSMRQCAKGGTESFIQERKVVNNDKWEIKIFKSKNVKIDYELSNHYISNSEKNDTLIKVENPMSSDIRVYNLEVEDDHTYVTEFGVVHNCDCDFLTSGNTVVEMDIIEFYRTSKVIDPIQRKGFDGNYWLWEFPSYTRNYIVAADVARGDGKDYSAFQVIDVETVTQVAEYVGKIAPKEFGIMTTLAAREWNNALLVIERETVGFAALQPPIDEQYPNLFYSNSDPTKYVDVQHQLKNKYYADERRLIPGFGTTMKTRPLIVSKLESYFRLKEIEARSSRLIEELAVFIWNGQKPQAMEGYNDDLVLSMCIALWVRDTALRLRNEGIDLTKTMLGSISRIGPTVMPIMQAKLHQAGFSQWHMKGPKGEAESLEWLIK